MLSSSRIHVKNHSCTLELFTQIRYIIRYNKQSSVRINLRNCKSKKLLEQEIVEIPYSLTVVIVGFSKDQLGDN